MPREVTAPSTPAPTLAEVEAWFAALLLDAEREAAGFDRDRPDCEMLLREAASYRLALSCVRAVRAMEEGKVVEVHGVSMSDGAPISYWNASRPAGFEHHADTALAAILTAIKEPPHAE